MEKEMKDEIEKRCTEILFWLNTNWKIKFKLKCEELIDNGLDISGVGIKMKYDLLEEYIFTTANKIDEMFENIRREFNDKIPLKELRKLLDETNDSLLKYIDIMEKDITDSVKSNFIPETCRIKAENIKVNINLKLKRIYDKNKNLNEFKKIKWLVIINTFATIGGFIIGIISLIKN